MRWSLILAAAVALAVPAGSVRAAGATFPVLYVLGNSPGLSGEVDLDFDPEGLDSTGPLERLVITAPGAYGIALVHAHGKPIGRANLVTRPLSGGAAKDLLGDLMNLSPGDYLANSDAVACAPGNHSAYWAIEVGSTAAKEVVPIAVDRVSEGYRFTMCFDGLYAQHLQVSIAEFIARGVFATPTHAGRYLFDAVATPFAADGTADTANAYELRAYSDLPASLTITSGYSAAGTLSATGAFHSSGKPKVGVTVQIWGGANPAGLNEKLFGTATTGKGGRYSFTRRVSAAPKFVSAQVVGSGFPVCSGSSPEPGGCASYSVDGAVSLLEPVSRSK